MSSELTLRPLDWNELPYKTDITVWIPLTLIQKKIYILVCQNQALKDAVRSLDKRHIFVFI